MNANHRAETTDRRRAALAPLHGDEAGDRVPLAREDAGGADHPGETGALRPLASADWEITRADLLTFLALLIEGAAFLALVKGMP